MAFGSKRKAAERGQALEALSIIGKAITDLNDTLVRIEAKVDVIHKAYEDLNQAR